jgi:hypothetical protein
MMSVEIPEKMIGLAWAGPEPLWLEPGVHEMAADGFVLRDVVGENTSHVEHGGVHRVCVRPGHLAVAWVDGRASLLEPGVSFHTCPCPAGFSLHLAPAVKELVLGPFRIVHVDEAEVGITFRNRQPEVLLPGR